MLVCHLADCIFFVKKRICWGVEILQLKIRLVLFASISHLGRADIITKIKNTPVCSTSIKALEMDENLTLIDENYTIDLNSGEKAVARLMFLDGVNLCPAL